MLKNIPFYASLLGKDLGDGQKSTHSHVLVYGAIEAHSFGPKGCIASNKTIAEDTGYQEATIAKTISQLNKAGWIKTSIDSNNHRINIIPLLEISKPLPTSKDPISDGYTPLYQPVNIEYSIENTVIDNDITNVISVKTQRVYDKYISTFRKNPNLYKLSNQRKTKIRARLKDAGEEMLTQAIENAARIPWFNGENDRHWQGDLDYIVRNYENVERLATTEIIEEERQHL